MAGCMKTSKKDKVKKSGKCRPGSGRKAKGIPMQSLKREKQAALRNMPEWANVYRTVKDFIEEVKCCPNCSKECGRHSLGHRWIKTNSSNYPVLLVFYSKHRCPDCGVFSNPDMTNLLAPARKSMTNSLCDDIARRYKMGWTYERIRHYYLGKMGLDIPISTIHDNV